MAANPLTKDIPRTVHPEPIAPEITIGWLLDSAAAGRVPAPPSLTPDQRADLTLHLVLDRSDASRPGPCRPLRAVAERTLRAGDALRAASGSVEILYLAPDGGRARSVAPRDRTVVVRAGPVRVRLLPRPSNVGDQVVVCG
jgi:hypothetical protein